MTTPFYAKEMSHFNIDFLPLLFPISRSLSLPCTPYTHWLRSMYVCMMYVCVCVCVCSSHLILIFIPCIANVVFFFSFSLLVLFFVFFSVISNVYCRLFASSTLTWTAIWIYTERNSTISIIYKSIIIPDEPRTAFGKRACIKCRNFHNEKSVAKHLRLHK